MMIIICDVCGCEGKAGNVFVQDKSEESLFRHLGHDPYQCNMHYCCPSCGALLSVNPMEMLSDFCVKGHPCNDKPLFSEHGAG